jgi:hypothetical protein
VAISITFGMTIGRGKGRDQFGQATGVGSYTHATELRSNVVIRPQEIELSPRLLHRAWPPEKSPEGLSNQPSLFDYTDAPGT